MPLTFNEWSVLRLSPLARILTLQQAATVAGHSGGGVDGNLAQMELEIKHERSTDSVSNFERVPPRGMKKFLTHG